MISHFFWTEALPASLDFSQGLIELIHILSTPHHTFATNFLHPHWVMSTYQSTAEDANIILCAIKCNVPYNFHTYKIILSITSQVFHDMFNLSQPGPLTIPPGAVVPVDNTPEDLEVLLHMIYPFWSPTTSTLDKVLCGLIMFDKYQVPHEPHNPNPLRSRLVSPEFLQSNPIWAYSLTCHWRSEERRVGKEC